VIHAPTFSTPRSENFIVSSCCAALLSMHPLKSAGREHPNRKAPSRQCRVHPQGFDVARRGNQGSKSQTRNSERVASRMVGKQEATNSHAKNSSLVP
jgi:hypothetical protein